MRLETVFYKGKKDMPLAIFIHGMGMNLNAWANPLKAKILGGKYPLRTLCYGADADMITPFMDLKRLGFSVLSWTQSSPAGPIQIAVNEFEELMKEYLEYGRKGVILIGHSRGGLIARKYLDRSDKSVKGLITLATPHHGTSMAKWAVYLSPVTSVLNQLLKGFKKEEVDSALQRVLGFFTSSGLRELLAGSSFYATLKDRKEKGKKYLSIGGTSPDLLRAIAISLPGLIEKVVPGRILPEEMREGYGDGLVTAASSMLPYADEHINFHVNHASILFDREVRDYIIKSVESF